MPADMTLVSMDSRDPWVRRLWLPAYQVKDAARYVDVTTQTVRNWQKAGTDTGSAIAPRELREALSYLQLQELAIVSVMRHQGVKLQKIRLARDYLSSRFMLEFPFADPRVKSDGQDVLMEIKDDLGDEIRLMVANRGGQYVWEEIIGRRFAEFEYERDLAVRWHIGGEASGVVIDPRICFGAPAIKGVPTWALSGRYKAGESIPDLASDFVISRADVRRGLKFERISIH
jgi:uncharacterized protein (DUF433 family)/DNA-binding transcriptional MerR regulator